MPNQFLTPKKVRFFLMDRGTKDNFLIDGEEFSDSDIYDACELMVGKFNTTDPILQRMFYTPSSFAAQEPSLMYIGCVGIAAILLRSKAINMTRNRLDVPGAIVDDKQNAAAYLQIADKLDAEFTSMSSRLKGSFNINGRWGRLGGTMETAYGWTV